MSFQTSDQNNSIFNFFIDNTRFTLLMLAGAVMMGTFALFGIDIESNPEINQPIALVQTFYPNSSPADVESSITKILEEEISGLSQLKEISSNSTNNISSISVTFESSSDPKEVIDNLREAVSNAQNELPSDAETPRVIELDFNSQSIVTLSVLGEQVSKQELTTIAEDISDKIKAISGVSKTELSGDLEQVVKIILDPVKLEAFNLSFGEVLNTLNSSNINAPLGSINKQNEELNIRLLGKVSDLEELRTLSIRGQSLDNSISFVTLGDVAEVKLEALSQKTESLVSDKNGTPSNSVTINVFKSKGGNVINIVNSIDAEIEKINPTLPEGVSILKTNDNAFFIKTDIANLGSNGYQTMIIIFFALLIFLTYREALVAALAVPLIFLMTFAILFFSGQTLNGLTIFSLILSLGLIVDTAIVIIEGIHEYRNEGYSKVEAAKKSLATYQIPLISGTLTTVAAFAPMLLVGGIVGEYIRTIPIVLSVTLFSSLFVSFVFTPLLANKFLKAHSAETVKSRKQELLDQLKIRYREILELILNTGKVRKLIVTVTLVLFVISMSFPVTGILRAQLFPATDTPFIYVNLEAPTGTSLEDTKALSQPVIDILNNDSSVKNFVLNLGTKIDTSGSGGAPAVKSNYGNVIVNLIEDESERAKSFEISASLRDQFAQIEGIKVTVEEVSSGPPASAPFDVRIIGPDLEGLKEVSFALKEELESVEGLVNISTDFDNLSDEVNLVLDQSKLRFYGVSNQQVALVIAAYTNGIDNNKLELNGEDFDIKVFLEDSTTKDVENLESLLIATNVGNIPLSYLGEFKTEQAVGFIPRIDQERSARVSASTNDGIVFADIKPITDEIIANFELPTGYSFDLGGEDEDIQESFADLFNSMFIAVILILVILVLQFNSFRQTILILFTIPLAVIGIFPGLALLGLPLSFPAFLGIVMLCGIVVNDAIVMIDQVNYNRANGIRVKEALLSACSSRIIPIIMTSITTILGLLPISITDEFWRGLGFSVIFGLTTATFLTLVIIPIFYMWLYRKDVQKEESEIQNPTPSEPIENVSQPVIEQGQTEQYIQPTPTFVPPSLDTDFTR